MTTLPTTTPMRLPRPAGATPLAMPASLGGGGAQAANAFQMNGADVWRVIRSNIWLILGMFILSVGVGFGLNEYLKRYHSRFTATGLVQVLPPVNMARVINGELDGGGDVNMLG